MRQEVDMSQRFSSIITVALVAALSATLAISTQRLVAAPGGPVPGPGSLVADHLTIVDAKGRPRIKLGVNEEENLAYIVFLTAKDELTFQIDSGSDGSRAQMFTPSYSGPLIELTAGKAGGELYLCSGKPNLELIGPEDVVFRVRNAEFTAENRLKQRIISVPLIPK